MTNPLYDAVLGQHAGLGKPLLHLPDGETLSYAQMAGRVAQFAGVLDEAGLRKGDRLALQAPKSPDALALYLACLRTGVVFLPLNTAYTAREIEYFLEDAEPRLVVCDPSMADALMPIAQAAGASLLTMGEQGTGSFADAAETAAPSAVVAACETDDLACILYTSGTTGRSKGAMLTQGNLLSNAQALAALWAFSRDDVLLHALPIFHAHGLFVACNVVMLRSGSMIWLPRFDTEAVLAALPRATTMMGVPTFYTRLLDSPEFNRARVGHMRLFTSGSAPLLAETHAAFSQRTGHAILERYGMTETGMNTSNPYEGERRAGTVGLPLPGVTVRVTDPETGAVLPAGQTGMIEVRGPNVFSGYWRMPEKTAEELRDTGFFITGDLGFISPDGYVTIVGRQKDLIITGGFNVYPKEIELVLDGWETVLESAVIGVKHPDFGEAVVAVVVPQPGATVDVQALLASAGAELAKYKIPKRIFVVDALPRNTMGKVQKAALRERYAQTFVTED
ncbi:malonyl-CoA synthase [Cognatishimia sp. F0-27]|uniref:malonate--CoA ligase n=1 Tax=Cognatishimia sp. F0-27 TaxID=2816855 RepID=UPI001D0C9D1A|nr:malonyl-CoA synthase [Cognatishimia sp. F0-27]